MTTLPVGRTAGPVLSVDLGGTHMRCAAVHPDGSLSSRREQPTPHDGTGVEALIGLVRSVLAQELCSSAVMGVPGRVDYRAGVLDLAPNLPQGWVPSLTEASLAEGCGLAVALANDADLAGVGEAYHGAGRDYSDVAYLTISTGIGAGIVLGGLLVHGSHSLAEVGHCVIDLSARREGKPATWEELASGTALGRLGLGAATDVIGAVRAGEANAVALWDDVVFAIGVGISNLVLTFSPQVVVIGGGVGLVGDLLLGPVRKAVPDVPIISAGLGDDAGLVGAASWAKAFVPAHAGRA